MSSESELSFNIQGTSSSEWVVRFCFVIGVGIVVSALLALAVGAVFLPLRIPVFLFLVSWVLWGALVAGRRFSPSNKSARQALSTAAKWSPDQLPREYRFITDQTMLGRITEVLGPCTCVRGNDRIQALQYNLPNGSAVLIFPEWPFKRDSRILGVHMYDSDKAIPLFP